MSNHIYSYDEVHISTFNPRIGSSVREELKLTLADFAKPFHNVYSGDGEEEITLILMRDSRNNHLSAYFTSGKQPNIDTHSDYLQRRINHNFDSFFYVNKVDVEKVIDEKPHLFL